METIVGTQKRVRISHGKRAIRVRAIEVLLYFVYSSSWCHCLVLVYDGGTPWMFFVTIFLLFILGIHVVKII